VSQGLAAVREFRIPSTLLDKTLAVLADAGNRNAEAFVLWGGSLVAQHVFKFTIAIKPAQTSASTFHGLLVNVDGDALFAVNKELYHAGSTLGGQVHSHPTDAFHSETDDHYPLVTLTGALSLVVPYFAVDARKRMTEWAWYRLAGYGKWLQVGDDTKLVIEP
jgi:hypothetical protein